MPSLESYDTFNVGATTAVPISADTTDQKKITNAHGGKLFYKTAADVDTGDTEVAVGSSVTVEGTVWVISETQSTVLVQHKVGSTVQDLTVTDKAYVTGELEVDGELNHDGTKIGFFGVAPASRQNVKAAAEVNAKEICEALEKYGLLE